ncbi:hypothetical protein GS492_09585 [Rhodococcus hoagii]|nr:hypothetical protein [Prescottella equi]
MARNEPQTFIVPFAVRIDRNQQYKHSGTGDVPLSNFDGEGADLLPELDAFVHGLPNTQLVQRDDRHFGRPRDITRSGRVLRWTMEGGESGKERDIVLDVGEKPRKRTRRGVEYSAYHAYAVIPKNSVTGWILVEKDGGDSLPSEWRAELVRQFKIRHPKFKLVVSQVRSASLWREVENALEEERVLSVEVAMRAEDKDPSATTGRGFPREALASTTDLYLPPHGKKGKGAFLRSIRRAFTFAKSATNGIIEIDLEDDLDELASEDLDVRLRSDVLEITARVTTDNGKRRKTIRFSGIREPFESYLVEGLSDRITPLRFADECRAHVKDLALEGGVTLAVGWDTGDWEPESILAPMEVNASDDEAEEVVAAVVELADVRPGA